MKKKYLKELKLTRGVSALVGVIVLLVVGLLFLVGIGKFTERKSDVVRTNVNHKQLELDLDQALGLTHDRIRASMAHIMQQASKPGGAEWAEFLDIYKAASDAGDIEAIAPGFTEVNSTTPFKSSRFQLPNSETQYEFTVTCLFNCAGAKADRASWDPNTIRNNRKKLSIEVKAVNSGYETTNSSIVDLVALAQCNPIDEGDDPEPGKGLIGQFAYFDSDGKRPVNQPTEMQTSLFWKDSKTLSTTHGSSYSLHLPPTTLRFEDLDIRAQSYGEGLEGLIDPTKPEQKFYEYFSLALRTEIGFESEATTPPGVYLLCSISDDGMSIFKGGSSGPITDPYSTPHFLNAEATGGHQERVYCANEEIRIKDGMTRVPLEIYYFQGKKWVLSTSLIWKRLKDDPDANPDSGATWAEEIVQMKDQSGSHPDKIYMHGVNLPGKDYFFTDANNNPTAHWNALISQNFAPVPKQTFNIPPDVVDIPECD